MTGTGSNTAAFSTFNGLRTDTPASKCPADYSPDCADVVFSVGGYATRNPLRVVDTLPSEIKYRKEFVGRDSVTHIIFLCADGSIYAQNGSSYTLIDQVAPGSECNSVTAYGREYMAFFNANGGSDAPRCWDGKNMYRVSQGGPGAAPSVSCISLPSSELITGSASTPVTIVTATPTDPQQVQVGGGGGPDEYDPPIYQTFYMTLTVVTATPHALSVGNVVSIAGNTLWNATVAYVSAVIDATTFVISYQQQDGTVGTGGTVTASAPLLSRKNNEVQATTSSPHGLRVGFKAAISGVPDLSYAITSIQTNSASYPNEAEITFPSDHGFVPGDTISIINVPYVNAGGGVMGYDIRDGIASVTTNSAHGLSVGLEVTVSLHTYAPRNVIVSAILSPTVWTYETEEPNVTDTGGYVHVPFPGDVGAVYTVAEVPSSTTVRVAFAASDFTWTGGNVTFPWNGSFYVDSVPTATSFTYHQSGPDATLQSGTGTVTPQGQISPGEHLCCEHYITDTGSITPPSPWVRFTAKVNQYPLVQLSKGPANVKARVLSFTGVNGGAFSMLLIPARVGGVQVSTSTVIQDNTTSSAVVDFPDTALLSGTRIDVPGNDLFEVFPLTTPDGVDWYGNRLAWKGEKNVMLGMENMAFDGGTTFTDTNPRAWTVVGSGGSVVQSGFMPVYQIAAGQSGEITQGCVRRFDGGQIMQENTRYTMRLWVDASHSGSIIAQIKSASLPFFSTAAVQMTGRGYMQADFDTITPASIPDDMILSVKSSSGEKIQIRDMQMIYRDNPNRWPTAVMSYVQSPDTYDFVTGIIGPSNDSTELRAMFHLQENFYFVTAKSCYYVQQVGNTEPSAWNPDGIADECPAFNANSVVTGKAWAMWAGDKGVFWFTGGTPNRASAVIDPTWRTVQGITHIKNDGLDKRVYFGVTIAGINKLLVYDYREQELGGVGKWTPWNRPVNRISSSSQYGILFASGAKTYRLDSTPGIVDDDFGNIGGYYVFAAAGASTLYQKTFDYLAMRMTGLGSMTPTVSSTLNPSTVTRTLNTQQLDALTDPVIEYNGNNLRYRLMFLKIGNPGCAYAMEEVGVQWKIDQNSPMSGVRR